MSIFDSIIEKTYENGDIKLYRENDEGNIEYKLQLDTKDTFRLKKLTSQMNYRLDEGKICTGKKEVYYVLGITDDGEIGKLNDEKLSNTYRIFEKVVEMAQCVITHSEKKIYPSGNLMYSIVQKIEKGQINEFNVVFVGPSQHGKTTTISHLSYGQHDNGEGYARNFVFKHEHEKLNGITSDIKKEIIGITNGKLINYNIGIKTSWEDIVKMSDKVINMIDLPGNNKYLKSTIFGLSTFAIDAIVIVLNSSRVDQDSMDLVNFYKSYSKLSNIPYIITCINENNILKLDDDMISISNLGYLGYNELVNFIDKSTIIKNDKVLVNDMTKKVYEDCIFYVADIYSIPDVGITFSGTMKSGNLSIKDDAYLTNSINYYPIKIKSIQRKQIDSHTLYYKESGAVRFDIDSSISSLVCKHMMIVKKKYPVHEKLIFKILFDAKNIGIKDGQKCLLFIDNNISPVIISLKGDTIYLKLIDKIIIPNFDNDIKELISFIKTDNDIIVGILSMIK